MATFDLVKTLGDGFNGSPAITDAFQKADSVINHMGHKEMWCSISGGADSDVMLDIIHRVDVDRKVHYVWFDTGLEYQATKDHLRYLEGRYDICIERESPIKPIPTTVREYGQPFLSKYVSEQLESMQRNGFSFEDMPYEELVEKYPKMSSRLKWWCNEYVVRPGYTYTRFNIAYNKWLKEFLIVNPPKFKISAKCCKYAKKDVSRQLIKRTGCDLIIVGVRKAEGGIRSSIYKECYGTVNGVHQYRPLFWFGNTDRADYEHRFDIIHSACYTEYGFTRTGCAGCPYNKNALQDLECVSRHEPNLVLAANNIFNESYEYTRMYREFCVESERKLRDEAV